MNKHNAEQLTTPSANAYDREIHRAIARRTSHTFADGK